MQSLKMQCNNNNKRCTLKRLLREEERKNMDNSNSNNSNNNNNSKLIRTLVKKLSKKEMVYIKLKGKIQVLQTEIDRLKVEKKKEA